MADVDQLAAEQDAERAKTEEDDLTSLWEVFSTSDGEPVVRGLSEEDAASERDRMQAERDQGVDGDGNPQAHGTEALSESYGVPAGPDADGTMQFNEVQHDPPLRKAEPRTYDIRPCGEPQKAPFSQWPDDQEPDGDV